MSAKKQQPCPYCGAPTLFIDSKRIYGRSYGWLLVCGRYPDCDAYVGCHGNSKNPLGRLANAELREAKKGAHATFDPRWRDTGIKRKDAYKWLADQLGISLNDCHIGAFDVEQCRRVIEICQATDEPDAMLEDMLDDAVGDGLAGLCPWEKP